MAAIYEDLVRLDLPRWLIGEIISGELVVRRLPRPNGTNAHSALIAFLVNAFRNSWKLLARVELCLGTDVFVPDLSGWTRERLPVIPDAPWIELPPEFVCDVLTDQSRGFIRDLKPAAYARHGIGYWWIVDADAETVEVNELAGDGYQHVATFSGDTVLRARPFDTLDIELRHMWV